MLEYIYLLGLKSKLNNFVAYVFKSYKPVVSCILDLKKQKVLYNKEIIRIYM